MTSQDGDALTSVLDPVHGELKPTSPIRDDSSEASSTTLPARTSSPSIISRSTTLAGSLSRSSSPSGRLSLSFSRFTKSPTGSPLANASEANDNIRSLIIRAFSPTIAICSSPEVEELASRKGIQGGFERLIRPFGERVSGKVVVRDSTGASRAWDDFGVRFINLARLAQDALNPDAGASLDLLEDLLDQYLDTAESLETGDGPGGISPYFQLFLGRLLSSVRVSQHEAFLHPVATIVVISSGTPSPIDTLRNLYQQTAQGSQTLPSYANPEYLRYYVLVHDEDRDDYNRSSALFDQMKRHFGLHCHLLRLKSTLCTQTDDDVEELAQSEWLTASEDLNKLQDTAHLIDLNTSQSPYIFTADAASIRTFIRELVAQSVVPHMEQRIATWNEQIASKRRGLSGRFMTFSKRWAGLGTSSKSSASAGLGGSGSSGNYDSVQEFYGYDTPEALLRRMADFSMMLRDYKLAASTYELLKSDYSNDKAWKYLAGANEMCCTASLLNPLAVSSSRTLKIEALDQMLETASYSYLTRCSQPALTVRAILLGVELMKVRGPLATEMAAKWAVRVLQMNAVGSIGHVLVSERVTSCLYKQNGLGTTTWGTRRRKAAFWSVMAADEWMKLGKAEIAAARMDEAQEMYQDLRHGASIHAYDHMSEFVNQLQLAVKMKLGQARQRALSGATNATQVDDEVEEVIEELEQLDTRPHRRSMMGAANPLLDAPASPVRYNRPDPLSRDDDFE